MRQKKERPWMVRSDVDSQLRELVEVRLDLMDTRVQNMNRFQQMTTAVAQKAIKGLLRQIDARIAQVEELIRARCKMVGEHMLADLKTLQSEKGIGWVTAITLLVLMPEIGTATRTQISALSGLAPLPDDSGKRSGRRYIRGGRKSVRCALYMASLSFVRWNEPLRAMYQRLRNVGKEEKVARTAAMRKMLVRLHAKLRDARAERTKNLEKRS
jgi:transposase